METGKFNKAISFIGFMIILSSWVIGLAIQEADIADSLPVIIVLCSIGIVLMMYAALKNIELMKRA